MKTIRFIGMALFAVLMCVNFASCSKGGDDPIEPTPKPEVTKSEITIDSSVISNGLSFSNAGGDQSISFTTNESWTLSVANTTSGATWCTASTTSGFKGTANVKFTVTENTDYNNRSVTVTIKSGTATKTFTISQKGIDALLVTTDKYEINQEGGTIEIEVKANIDYQMEIAEDAKDWIKESSSRSLTAYKHKLDIVTNEEFEKREGEVYFKSGDKVETVKVYQAGGAIILLSKNEYNVSDEGETISVDIRSNIDFGVQMPNVDWIVDEASSRGMSSHTLKYLIASNEGYDDRSAEIIFYDKNSDLKDTLKVVQAQKDAIVISEKNVNVAKEGGTIEIKVNTNVNLEVLIPSGATWISQISSRTLTEKSVYLNVSTNTNEDSRSATLTITNKDSQVSETVVVIQQGNTPIVTLKEAGTMKALLGNDYLKMSSLKVVGPINGDDIYYLRKMLGGSNFSEADWGKLTKLDLSEATIVEGGEWYMGNQYTSKNEIGDMMFQRCKNLKIITLPNNVISIGKSAFDNCSSLTTIKIPDSVTSIGEDAFKGCESLTSIIIPKEITSISESTFLDCKSLTSIDIPNSVTTIGDFAFSGCTSLTSIKLPDSVTSLGVGAISYCDSLTSITIPKNITTIGKAMFRGCKSLKSIIIPNGITSIGFQAFYACTSLTSVSIPASVTSIGEMAFYYCKKLESVTCYATTPPRFELDYTLTHGEWVNFEQGGTLYVPARCGALYKSNNIWKFYFKNIIEIE